MSAVEEIPDTAQHYIECGTEDCEKNCQFYCNPCHQPMCEQCRDEHQKNSSAENHEVVPYRQRRPKLPEMKCKLHPARNVEILCKECNIPICPKCIFSKEHFDHKFADLEEKYAENVKLWQIEISKANECFLSPIQGLKMEIKEDETKLKEIMDGIRSSIKAEAESLKELVDKVTSEKLEEVKTMEDSLHILLKSQEKTIDDYTAYLNNLTKNLSTNLRIFCSDDFQNLKIQSIPETTQPVLPVFTAGKFSRDDVTKLLGRVNVPNHEQEKRKIPVQPIKTTYSQLRPTEKDKSEDRDVKQTLSLCSSVTKVREYTVPGVKSVYHISLGKSGWLWGSDHRGNLVQTDLQGNQLLKIQTSGGSEGYHTVPKDGDLLFTDSKNKVIYRLKQDKTITEFIKTGDWAPFSVHSSHINGDILVGMIKDREAKVTRYNKTGEEIQNIQWDNKGQELYGYPGYITENINGDICTSDSYKRAVVVVNKSGQYRFSYTGQGSQFWPRGICTDLLGHIIVCDTHPILNTSVHVLDQDGQFLSVLLPPRQGIAYPRSLCVDDENNLHVGQYKTNTVTVYKYLQ